MRYCATLFILFEQYSLSWRISIEVCPDEHGEGSRVSLEHLQSTVFRRASVTSTSSSEIYCPNAIIVNDCLSCSRVFGFLTFVFAMSEN